MIIKMIEHRKSAVATLIVIGLITGCKNSESTLVANLSNDTPIPSTTLSATATPIPPTAIAFQPTETNTSLPTETATPLPTNTSLATATELAPLNGSGGGVIAFSSNRDGNMDIYLMNANGSGQRRLTTHTSDDYWPSWSPDSNKIAFASERDGNFDIYSIEAPGIIRDQEIDESLYKLQRITENPATDLEPAWSPNGDYIAFMSDRDGNWEIYILEIDRDGSNPGAVHRLTNHKANDWLPCWSPDGTQIAFMSDRDGNEEIYRLDVETAIKSGGIDGAQRLTNNDATDSYPAWSPEGEMITFVSNRMGSQGLFSITVQNGEINMLFSGDSSVWVSSWSPDGKKIAFTSDHDGNREIYLINPDGSNLRRLTENASLDGTPAWRPRQPVTQRLTPTPIPPRAYLEPMNHQWQTLNNCHRASIATLMGYYDVWFSQGEYDLGMDNLDEFVSSYGLKARIYAIRYSNYQASDIIRWFLAEGIPVIVGQDLSSNDNTWHYRVARGYDDGTREIIVDDTLLGSNLRYSYEIFNQLSSGSGQFIPIYPEEKDDMIQTQMRAWQMKLIEYP